MARRNVLGHKEEPELKRAGGGASCDLGRGSGWPGPLKTGQ